MSRRSRCCSPLVPFLFLVCLFPACAAFRAAPDQAGGPPVPEQDDPRSMVVARVNDVPVTMAELIGLMNRAGEGMPASPDQRTGDEVAAKALNKLILQELAFQQARDNRTTAAPHLVDESLANLRTNLGGEQALRAFLARERLTERELRARIERSLILELMYAREVLGKVTVPENELQAEYERGKDRFQAPEKITVIDVAFLSGHSGPAQRSAAETVLRRLSTDPDRNPWKLMLDGTFIVRRIDCSRPQDRELADAARALKPNELSAIIPAADGLHIIKLIDHVPARQLALDDVRGNLEGPLRVKAQEARLLAWERELRSAARIEIVESALRIPAAAGTTAQRSQ